MSLAIEVLSYAATLKSLSTRIEEIPSRSVYEKHHKQIMSKLLEDISCDLRGLTRDTSNAIVIDT